MSGSNSYYLPSPSYFPLLGSVGLFLLLGGLALVINGHGVGTYSSLTGLLVFVVMLFGWFGTVIGESERGAYNDQVDRSFRWGMSWFIFSEVMFFVCFFSVLYYVRCLSVPWLAGEGAKELTGQLLWPSFKAVWPLLTMPDAAGAIGGNSFTVAKEAVKAGGIPAWNTLILLTSGVTVTWAHWGLKRGSRATLILGLFLTVALGVTFVAMQAYEYHHAYTELNFQLSSGVYGTTFYMLTGFHGLHVTLGTIMLLVVWFRSMKGHFTPERHFAFEAVSWYWHFVDVVWLGLFIFVYWL
jgi:cytochrome c oxidase subunit 3